MRININNDLTIEAVSLYDLSSQLNKHANKIDQSFAEKEFEINEYTTTEMAKAVYLVKKALNLLHQDTHVASVVEPFLENNKYSLPSNLYNKLGEKYARVS